MSIRAENGGAPLAAEKVRGGHRKQPLSPLDKFVRRFGRAKLLPKEMCFASGNICRHQKIYLRLIESRSDYPFGSCG